MPLVRPWSLAKISARHKNLEQVCCSVNVSFVDRDRRMSKDSHFPHNDRLKLKEVCLNFTTIAGDGFILTVVAVTHGWANWSAQFPAAPP